MVDQNGNVIPDDGASLHHAVNGVNKAPAADGDEEKKRPAQSQDISLHNLNDFN